MARRRSKKELQAIYSRIRKRSTPLFPHQERVVRRLQNQPRLLVYHGLGSGKTTTGLIAAANTLKENKTNRVLFITPAGLTKNIEKEQQKHNIRLPNGKRTQVLSFEKAVKTQEQLLKAPPDLTIVDEAHKLRERGTKRFQTIAPILEQSKKVLLLSGSPMYHEPTNLSTLVNVLAKKRVLPEDKKIFAEKFVRPETVDSPPQLRHTKALQKVLSQYVDYHEPSLKTYDATYPQVKESEIKVPLSHQQNQIYSYLESRLPKRLRHAVHNNLLLSKRDFMMLVAFATGVRQVSNASNPFVQETITPDNAKINLAVSNLYTKMKSDPKFRGLVYSNYLAAGLLPYQQELQKRKISHKIISGNLSSTERQKIVQEYNEGEHKVLLISSAGGEGLDLKGTKLVQVLDPHWNRSKIDQVIGRAVRYKSHTHLPVKDRVVHVERYLGTIAPTARERLTGKKPTSIDEYLHQRSEQKHQIHHELQKLIRRAQEKSA